MKVVILAGGMGTRISEESDIKPKPMVEIGGNPILWHIMKYYSYYGYNEFVICCGYKSHVIKEYFADYYLYHSDITFDFSNDNRMVIHNNIAEPWKVTLVDTGLYTQTGARIKKVQKYIGNERFMLTYGDGVSDVDISSLLTFHQEHGKMVTMTTIHPSGKFGVVEIAEDGRINAFREKGKEDGGWINGGFMILEPEIFEILDDSEDLVFERTPLETLAARGQLCAYRHNGFWQCMDTLRDQRLLNDLIQKDKAPWIKWE